MTISTPLKTKVHIYRLVLVGWRITKIAKHLKLSRQAIDKHIRKLEQENLIEQTTKYPKFYKKKTQSQPPLSYSPISTFTQFPKNKPKAPTHPTLPLMLPTSIGALCSLIGKPVGLKYNSRGNAYKKEPGWSAQFGRSKAQVWVKSFFGSEPGQIEANGKEQLKALLKVFEGQFNIKLTVLRWYDGLEWVSTSKKRSKEIAKKAGISKGKGAKIRIGEAIHKFDDFSHPEFFQINPAHDAINKKVATDHAKTHYYLYMVLPGTLERIGKTLDKITDSIVVVNQKIEAVNKKIDGNYKP